MRLLFWIAKTKFLVRLSDRFRQWWVYKWVFPVSRGIMPCTCTSRSVNGNLECGYIQGSLQTIFTENCMLNMQSSHGLLLSDRQGYCLRVALRLHIFCWRYLISSYGRLWYTKSAVLHFARKEKKKEEKSNFVHRN